MTEIASVGQNYGLELLIILQYRKYMMSSDAKAIWIFLCQAVYLSSAISLSLNEIFITI